MHHKYHIHIVPRYDDEHEILDRYLVRNVVDNIHTRKLNEKKRN